MEHSSELSILVENAANVLRDSWDELGKKLSTDSKVKVYTKLAVKGSTEDIFGLVPILIGTHEKCYSVSKGQYEEIIKNLPPNGKPSKINSALEEIKKHEKQRREFASCYKAMFFFLRAFQDVLVRILFELNGKQSGQKTSMSNLLNPTNNSSLRSDLDRELPDYPRWFKEFRKIRNDMKYGLDISHGFKIGPQRSVVLMHTRRVHHGPNGLVHAIDEELSLSNILEALKKSNELINFIKQYCR